MRQRIQGHRSQSHPYQPPGMELRTAAGFGSCSSAVLSVLTHIQHCSVFGTKTVMLRSVCVWHKWHVLHVYGWAGGWMPWHEMCCFLCVYACVCVRVYVCVCVIFLAFLQCFFYEPNFQMSLLLDPSFKQHMVLNTSSSGSNTRLN